MSSTIIDELRSATAAASTDRQLWVPRLYLDAIRRHNDFSKHEVERVQKNLNHISDDDKASLVRKPDEQVSRMEEAVATNSQMLDKLAQLIREAAAAVPADTRQPPCLPQGSKPVQNLLQAFVREWSAEGASERRECFTMLLGALEGHKKADVAAGADKLRVLVPGCSLGRLAFEVQSRGFHCDACEGRVLNYFGAELMRRNRAKEAIRLQAFATHTCNRFRFEDHVRNNPLPDVEIEEGALPFIRFGDFPRLYDSAAFRASYDALLTSYSLDGSSNIFRFVRTVAHVVKPGGLWANFGPLAYDTDYDEARGHGLELSWEELRFAVSTFFEIQEEQFVESFCASNSLSMMAMQYSCIYFKAVRNDKPAAGIGEK